MTFDLRILEFEAVRALLAERCVCGLGRRRVESMAPLVQGGALRDAIGLVTEMMALMAERLNPPINDLRDVTPTLLRAARERALIEPEELLHLKDFLETAGHLRGFFAAHAEQCPGLNGLAQPLYHVPALGRSIDEKIAPNATVRDSASDDLRAIRADIAATEGHIQKDLQRMVRQLTEAAVLQDDFFTLRNGRYVLPVRTDCRGRVRGIIHDSSNSGETVFIEPLEILEQTNHLAELRVREREEVYRILLRLAVHVRDEMNVLQSNAELLGELDFVYAKARLGSGGGCAFPSLTDFGRPVSLVDAHHPLLYFNNPAASRPLNLALDSADRVLVVTGPNAGGKTTALKTMGLTVLMVQCAVPVPASSRSHLPVFSNVLADIGDEQNLLGGVSTFSAHVKRIATILDHAENESLVLLDELGTATDPGEGSALAVAILESLAERGALALATTHLGSLKIWAHSHAAARNASFRLSEQDHRPTFRLTLDLPGISEALVIAEQVGMPEHIIARARALRPAGEGEATGLLLSLQAKEQELVERLADAETMQAEVNDQKLRIARLEADIREERRTYKARMLEEHEKMMREERARIEAMIAHLPSKRELLEARAETEAALESVKREKTELRHEAESAAAGAVRVGDRVRLKTLNDEGDVLEVFPQRGQARVGLRNMVVTALISDLMPLAASAQPPAPGSGGLAGISYRRPANVNLSLDLHGKRVDEALDLADKFLDEALAGGLPYVRLVHGQGTGALRRALHEHLRLNPQVRAFRPGAPNEGAGAVTIVEFR